MHIYVFLRFQVKKEPKEYRGLISENWTIGKLEPMSMEGLITAIAVDLGTFFNATGLLDVEGVNNAIKAAGEKLIGLYGKFH